jgi:hypothetical protein
MNLPSGLTACSRVSAALAADSSGFLAGTGGGVSASVAGDLMGAGSGFLGGSGGSISADAGVSIWGRAGLANCVLIFLERLLTGRDAFVTVLAALARVNFGTRGCDCASAHFALTGDPA